MPVSSVPRTTCWPRAVALFAALVVTTSTAVASPASAAPAAAVTGVASERCLDVVGAGTAPGTGVIIWDCHGQDNQAWSLGPAGELTVYDDETCLDVADGSISPGARVQIEPCDAGPSQEWTVSSDGGIRNAESGLCLDVTGGSDDARTPVQTWTCNDLDHQKWTTPLTGSGNTADDATDPTAPPNPAVADLTCDSVTFSWDASTDDVGVVFYDVYHDGQLIESVSGGALSTELDVEEGTPWGLYVNARDAAGNVSPASDTVQITPPACTEDTTAPSTPEGLEASASGTSVDLSWTASTDEGGVGAYEIYRGDEKVSTVGTTTSEPPATAFTDSGLEAATEYTYSVIARDRQDNVSARSATATATTGAGCDNDVCDVETVTTDTDIPWGLVTLPDGDVLYNRRDAQDIIRLDPATGAKTTLGTVPNVESTDGEGGLTGLAIAEDFTAEPWLYIMHSSPTDNRIVRIKLAGDTLETDTEEVLIDGIRRSKFHDGGRLRFGPDGTLYAATGDAERDTDAQDLESLNGKILRLDPDGGVPGDNPFPDSYVFSYGHRNPQGLAFDSQGQLWEQEFGNTQLDETNLITEGGNYGWPQCEGTAGDCDGDDLIAPKKTYLTSDASCSGLTVVDEAVYIACARGQRMYRAEIDGSDLTGFEEYFTGTYGRLRTVEPAPGGGLWLTTTNGGDKDSTPNNSDNEILRVTLGG